MSDVAIHFDNVGKMYKVFSSPANALLDALNVPRLGRRPPRFREFWAVRGIDFTLNQGERLGIIGRNGAGKSTLLKLVTQNLEPTEGQVEVRGEVQALLEIGGGLHPEFTGRENIHAALGYLGLSSREIHTAEEDIAEFTELGRFLDQPFKAYSQGMQARLSFAIATTVRPEILIVDEILGAGDAYFFTRSTARMTRMIEGGASVLLVSHALDQVTRFCERTIWLDRGRVAMEGPSQEVVKAYERYIRELEDRRLQAKNRKAGNAKYDAFDRDTFTDTLVGTIELPAGGAADISRITLLRDGVVEDQIDVGDAQDGDPFSSSAILLDGSDWSAPIDEDGRFFRTVGAPQGKAKAQVRFNLWFFYPQSLYEVAIVYRTNGEGRPALHLQRASGEGSATTLPEASNWTEHPVKLAETTGAGDDRDERMSRWPGVQGLAIADVKMADGLGDEQTVFEVHRPLSVLVDAVATESGRFPLVPAALIFRLDGIVATRHIGERVVLDVAEGDRVSLRLDFGSVMLGNGTYLLSIGLYRELELNNTLSSTVYDYFDRSFEFVVTGNPPLHTEAFRHPGSWTVSIDDRPSQPDSAVGFRGIHGR